MRVQGWRLTILGAMVSLCAACGDDRASPAAPVVPVENIVNVQVDNSESQASSGTQDQVTLIDVASVYNGAFAADRTSILDATQLLSGMKNYGDYATLAKGADSRTDFLIELAAPATIEKLRFIGPLNENNAPQKIEAALSDSPEGDFEVIGVAEFDVVKNKDLYRNAFDISIPVSVKRSGRFLRFTMSGSLMGDPSQKVHAMASFQALGVFDQSPEIPEVNGVFHFQGNFGNDSSGGFYVSLQQNGDWVEGCAVTASSAQRPIKPERLLNLISGGVQNGVLHLERSDASGGNSTPGIVTFSSDGKFAHAAFFRKGSDPSLFGSVDRAVGQRIDTVPVACTTTQAPVQTALQVWEETLEKEKVLRLYGVNFDLDSDVLRTESYAVLDKVVAIAKEKPEWVFEVAGHTDSSGSAAHNRDLSQRRAGSVVRYLTGAGVEPSRLVAKGYGADNPLMSNDTAAGMAQNRRVELVRQ